MEYLKDGARKLGLQLSPNQLEQFYTYYQELLEWNQRINLTSITEFRDVQIRHFLDSLTVTLALKQPMLDLRLIDIGSGGGFPGLPLKIALPAIKLVLLEATAKKAAFLRHLERKLGLGGVEIVVGRAEEARADIRDVDVEMCGWVLGPRLNAAGRMASSPAEGRLALDLLLSESAPEAQRLAARLEELKRKVGFAKSWGLHAEVITTKEAREMVPLLTDNILGAMYNPTDGLTKGVLTDEALAKEAIALGAKFYGDTEVIEIEVKKGRIEAVVTAQGRIKTENVVAAAGIWGPRIGRMVGVSIPLYPMQHPLVKFGPLPELAGHTQEITTPAIRHQDKSMYAREYFEYYEVGSYGFSDP